MAVSRRWASPDSPGPPTGAHSGKAHPTQRAKLSPALPRSEMIKFLTRFQPESHRAILDMSFLPFRFQGRAQQVPMLVLGAGKDTFFPPYMVHSTAARFGTRAEIFKDMAHTMMLEPGWREVAERILVWLSTLPR